MTSVPRSNGIEDWTFARRTPSSAFGTYNDHIRTVALYSHLLCVATDVWMQESIYVRLYQSYWLERRRCVTVSESAVCNDMPKIHRFIKALRRPTSS
jgi:hypothetical protein